MDAKKTKGTSSWSSTKTQDQMLIRSSLPAGQNEDIKQAETRIKSKERVRRHSRIYFSLNLTARSSKFYFNGHQEKMSRRGKENNRKEMIDDYYYLIKL